MRASRGGSGKARSLRPSSVMRPAASIAPRSVEQCARLVDRSLRRRIEEGELCRIARAPLRQIEHEGRQIGRQNFRPRIGLQRAGLRLVPQPVADTRLGAAGAAAALVGGGARHAHGFQPCEADVRLVTRHARKPAVDDDAHALDGQRGLRDRGRQHHLAPPGRRRRYGAVLLARVERAVERDDIDGRIGHALLEQRLGAADFAGAGQEHQQRALIGAQGALHGVGHLGFDARARIAAEIARLDRKGAAFALDHRRAAEQRRHAGAVERRRHHQDFQFLAQALLHVARQRQSEIGIERALVKFVEQHGGDAVERRIVEDQPREHALGDHLDARALGNLRAEAHAQADGVAHLLAQGRGHAGGGGARRQPSRLQHQDFLTSRPRLVEQHQRHARGLAGARRRHQHGGVVRAQRRGQPRQRVVDGKRCVELYAYVTSSSGSGWKNSDSGIGIFCLPRAPARGQSTSLGGGVLHHFRARPTPS